MNWSDLPSLSSLRAFAALADAGSYTQAAAALNVSHAAVSQQVKALEERLGVPLVARDGRGIALTEEGAALARDLATGFAAIGRGVETLTGAGAEVPVQITMSPAFAVQWFMPRITEFQKQHPEITLMLNPTAEVVALKPGGIDLAIRYGDRRAPDAKVDPVLIADMVVVGTPALIGARDLTDPAMLVGMPWLQELGTNEVADWMARHGVTLDRPLMITHMPGNLIMEAVRRGDGITYTARPWVAEELRAGQLIELFSDKAFGIYYIVTRPGVLRRPVTTFVKWLKCQAAVEMGSRSKKRKPRRN
jgi:LysR family glycine cleavage system transcriptional activator